MSKTNLDVKIEYPRGWRKRAEKLAYAIDALVEHQEFEFLDGSSIGFREMRQ